MIVASPIRVRIQQLHRAATVKKCPAEGISLLIVTWFCSSLAFVAWDRSII